MEFTFLFYSNITQQKMDFLYFFLNYIKKRIHCYYKLLAKRRNFCYTVFVKIPFIRWNKYPQKEVIKLECASLQTLIDIIEQGTLLHICILFIKDYHNEKLVPSYKNIIHLKTLSIPALFVLPQKNFQTVMTDAWNARKKPFKSFLIQKRLISATASMVLMNTAIPLLTITKFRL